MATPLFIATERFDPSDAERWAAFLRWSGIPGLTEVASLDTLLCPRLISDIRNEDWSHIVNEDYRLNYFYHLDYLKQRVLDVPRRNILGLYRNSETHISGTPPAAGFTFLGYDLIEEATQISAISNCGGFPDVFRNDELNQLCLITSFDRAHEIRRQLAERHPDDPHARCEMYAIWRLNETENSP